ncbi:MAG: DUF1330 domain-containing protein [Bacteroidota bacterium]|nr:DUF1330 domain-containing protein [Bacteroidota bacterium]
MPAYVIVDIVVNDPVRYEEYKSLAAPTVAAYGGKYVVRGSPVHVLEGDWLPKRLVILEFESIEQAKKWWASPEYRDAKKIRHETAATNMIVVEGI